ncbi:MAG: DHA2 family efflux MFS transporter permease subunit [Gaiellaceae bacterium]
MDLTTRKRWLALYVICLADLMIVLDSTIVNVALPSIHDDLGFSQSSLAWVVNAYLLTFGGFLLLAGRLGDLFGQRRVFIFGIAEFTVASLLCGVSDSQTFLIVARAIQGLGGAVVAAIALSLILILFTDHAERAKAMGMIGFVLSGGGAAGVLLGGVLTDVLSWHWIFLVNVPVGIAAVLLCRVLLPADAETQRGSVDIAGAVTVTASLMLAVYAIVNGNEKGWTSGQTLGLLGVAVLLLAAFVWIEAHAKAPLMPLAIWKTRNIASANVTGMQLAAAMVAWFLLSALYLQQVLGYTALEVGFAFLPATVLWGLASLLLSDKLVIRFGIKPPLLVGLTCYLLALLLFARAPVDGNYFVDVLPGMLVLGIGGGITFNPILLAAMGSVKPTEAGLASGLVNTSFMFGGALGLAVLASAAASRTESLLSSGDGPLAALNGGYHLAFMIGAAFAVLAGVVAAVLIHADSPAQVHGTEPVAAEEPA